MISIIFILLLTLLAFKQSTFIRKHFVLITVILLVLSTLSYFLIETPIFTPFKQGYLGFSFFYLVMLAGSLKDKSKLRIALFKIRKEYSIFGFIAITPHALFYFLEFANGTRSLPVIGFSVYILMIPLFITSFHSIRKKFQYKTWKRIQSISYLIYVGLLVHLLLNATTIALPNIILYTVLFVIYFVLKIIFETKKKH